MTAEKLRNTEQLFGEAIDARQGGTTGISAYDRAPTINVAIDPATRIPTWLAGACVSRCGLVRAGAGARWADEASVDLARLAGWCRRESSAEIMKDDGTMARVPDLIEFCRTHDLKMLTGRGVDPLSHAE